MIGQVAHRTTLTVLGLIDGWTTESAAEALSVWNPEHFTHSREQYGTLSGIQTR